MITKGEQVLQALPLRGKQAELSARLESKRSRGRAGLEYVELYGLYTECEAIYQVDHLMEMWSGLDAEDQAAFGFDPRPSTGRRTSARSTCRRSSSTPA